MIGVNFDGQIKWFWSDRHFFQSLLAPPSPLWEIIPKEDPLLYEEFHVILRDGLIQDQGKIGSPEGLDFGRQTGELDTLSNRRSNEYLRKSGAKMIISHLLWPCHIFSVGPKI
jgi:hypothetical protein